MNSFCSPQKTQSKLTPCVQKNWKKYSLKIWTHFHLNLHATSVQNSPHLTFVLQRQDDEEEIRVNTRFVQTALSVVPVRHSGSVRGNYGMASQKQRRSQLSAAARHPPAPGGCFPLTAPLLFLSYFNYLSSAAPFLTSQQPPQILRAGKRHLCVCVCACVCALTEGCRCFV